MYPELHLLVFSVCFLPCGVHVRSLSCSVVPQNCTLSYSVCFFAAGRIHDPRVSEKQKSLPLLWISISRHRKLYSVFSFRWWCILNCELFIYSKCILLCYRPACGVTFFSPLCCGEMWKFYDDTRYFEHNFDALIKTLSKHLNIRCENLCVATECKVTQFKTHGGSVLVST